MSAPERLEPKQIGGQIMLVRDPEGEYVAWEDYATLAAKCEALEALMEGAQRLAGVLDQYEHKAPPETFALMEVWIAAQKVRNVLDRMGGEHDRS
jgi:hypothetical protein